MKESSLNIAIVIFHYFFGGFEPPMYCIFETEMQTQKDGMNGSLTPKLKQREIAMAVSGVNQKSLPGPAGSA